MKKIYNFFLILSLPSVLLLFSYSNGTPGGKTGSMGDGGSTCTDCHTGTAISQADWITSDIPELGFMPGETYTITARGMHEGVAGFGFELTAESETGDKTGMFSITDADRTKLANADKSVTHTSGGTTPTGDSNTWTMEWTAPDPAPEVILFNAAFNAANGNGSTSGDVIYTTEISVSQQHVGFADNKLTESTKIFPNPAIDKLGIIAPIGSDITVIDINGRIVETIKIQNENTSVDITSFESGLYFVKFIHDGGVLTHKLIIK